MQGCLFLSPGHTAPPSVHPRPSPYPRLSSTPLSTRAASPPPSPPQITCPNLRHLDQGMKGLARGVLWVSLSISYSRFGILFLTC